MSAGLEIERRFLVRDLEAAIGQARGERICQGYLSRDPQRVVRIRLTQGPQAVEAAWVTVKGAADPAHGATLCRQEWEFPIPPTQARELLTLCLPHPVEKSRHTVTYGGRLWVVDEFHGLNQGLALAEVELEAPDVQLLLPDWAGEEVGADPRYHNSALSARPFSQWATSASGSSS